MIFHIDINYFFCRVEEIHNKKLEHVPFVVCNRSKKSIITTSNYIARADNIKAAMSLEQALKINPRLEVVEPNMALYKKYSDLFFKTLKKEFTDEIEVVSIDECYMCVDSIISQYHNNYKILATAIINKLSEVTKLNVTIGISENKQLAKVAGDMKHPSKYYAIFQNEIKEKLWHQDISKINLIGKKTYQFLRSVGINTIADFVNYHDVQILKNFLKNKYNTILNSCNGIGDTTINKNAALKSISTSHSFSVGMNNIIDITSLIEHLVEDLYNQLVYKNILALTYSVSYKKSYQETISKSETLDYPITLKPELKKKFKQLFMRIWDDNEIWGISLTVKNFTNKNCIKKQVKLF